MTGLPGRPMTDYRIRNHDLLYASRKPQPLSWRNIAIFAAIGATVTFGVVGHLTDRFNTAPPGFPASAPPMLSAQRAPLIQLVTPAAAQPGS
jgi:hypothetical protein